MKLKPVLEAINVKTQQEYNNMMRLCETAGWEWSNKNKPTNPPNHWQTFKESTCIEMKISNRKVILSFCHKEAYSEDIGKKVISFQEFLKEQGLSKANISK